MHIFMDTRNPCWPSWLRDELERPRTIFRTLGLADAEGAWVGQSAVLVQTGDLLDRGEESGPLVRELFRLQDEAPKSGAPCGGWFRRGTDELEGGDLRCGVRAR